MQQGTTLLVSLDTVPSHGPSYASIAGGRHDRTIRAFLRSVNRAAVTYHLGAIYICFQHEADNPHNAPLGSPAQFRRAWDHVHHLARSAHLDWGDGGRLHWVLILEHAAYFRRLPHWLRGHGAGDYWPGSGQAAIVGVDGYSHAGCRGGNERVTPADLYGPALAFARAHGNKPVFVAEWGSQAGNHQPVFIDQMHRFVASHREITAVMYFDERSRQNLQCTSIIRGRASLAAMRAMAHAPALSGHVSRP